MNKVAQLTHSQRPLGRVVLVGEICLPSSSVVAVVLVLLSSPQFVLLSALLPPIIKC